MNDQAPGLQEPVYSTDIAKQRKGIDPRSRVLQKYMLILTDFFAILGGTVLALRLNGLTIDHPTFDVAVGSIAVMWISSAYFGAYSNASLVSYSRSLGGFVQGVIAAISICLLFLFAVKATGEISRLSLSMGIVLAIALSIIVRTLLVARNRKTTGTFVDRVVVFNDDTDIPESRNYHCVFVGHIDVEKALDDPVQLQDISELAKGMDRVIVACSRKRRAAWTKVLRSIDVQGEIFDVKLNRIGIVGTADLEGRRSFIVTPHALSIRQRILKRVFDIAVAGSAILALSPVLLITAIAILLEDGRPILFRQPRIGQGNRPFDIFKFRSMSHAMSDHAAAKLTSRNDARVTRVGAFIRRTSIDELPQLFNVLLGNMSVVGPRPHAVMARVQDKLYWEIDPRYWERHKMKPGMTGLAQVRGFRGATDEDSQLTDRVQADLEYLAHWSIFRDLQILFATLKVVAHPNAY